MKNLFSTLLMLSGLTLALPGVAHDHKEKAHKGDAQSHEKMNCEATQHDKVQHDKMDDAAKQAMMKNCAKQQSTEKAKGNTEHQGHEGHSNKNKQKHQH
ncbi:hypothetical protein KJY73_07015 [Bowmanella sp. Y26]|uniref:hypothetical protein n=1 Tax=Bowmanella yangjiangensis TaxID=2811230 RepID=UPI001BDD9FBB|nr:hypothetical protein [Bowmanella yangjiangensis]MBT1063318.1 hypothetical protein [Bowmanella yangjiangensis]